MTQSAAEIFTTQLARAAAKQANRFLSNRGLQKSDKDDVIASAMLWCWENRDKYSLTTTLETWFMNAVRNAYQDLQRNELPPSTETMEQIGGADETFNIAAAESSAQALINALTPAHKTVAVLTMRGYTRKEMVRKGISKRAIDEAHQRIRQLRRLLTDTEVTRIITHTGAAASPDDAGDEISGIDRELEQLDFAPASGKDCPPCWRCLWFEGFMPLGKRDTRMEIADAEVREAVQNTETRKVHIAQQVRSTGHG
jgi:DNA-directed RNA polymerase specialized sigma24 family protein